LDDSEYDRHSIHAVVSYVKLTPDPIQDVEGAVGTQSQEVEGVDYGGDCSLAEEKKLGEDTDGLEDCGEDPEELLDNSSDNSQ